MNCLEKDVDVEIEKIEFRFIRPLWYKRGGMVITCLEPVTCTSSADVCADNMLRHCNSAANAYTLGFVDAEKHVLADLLVHQDDFELTYYAKARHQLQNCDACPRFVVEAPEGITFDEKVVALATYNYSIQKCNDDELDAFVAKVYELYFALWSLAMEEEDDPWNYSPERETVDFSSTNLHGSRWTAEEAMQEHRQLCDKLRAQKTRGFEQLPRGSTCPRHGWIDGRHYVLKCGSFSGHSSDGHVHNECVADALLRTAGCRVPESWEFQTDIGNGRIETLRLSRFIENGSDLRPAFDKGSAERRQKLIAQIIDTYPAIAFIDGTDSYQHYALDNVLVDEDYNLWYIDNGASFDYRARGLLKDRYWKRYDPQDGKNGFYAVWDYASDSFKTIVQSVSKSDLRKSAARYDFVELVKTLPPDYQRPELLDYAKALNKWARGVSNNHSDDQRVYMCKDKRTKGGNMTKEDCEWLEAVSLRIAKMVRRIDKFIDEGKIARTATSRTAEKYAAEVDVARLQKLAVEDASGRVNRLLDVCDDIANSAAAGYSVKVLSEKWDRNAASSQRPGRKGNVDFSEYAFTRAGFEAAGGAVSPAGHPVRPTRPRKAQTNQQSNIEVVCGNVEEIEADAVVNAANEGLRAGSGICGAIFRRAGYVQLQAACDKVAPCPTGEARVTPAFGITNAKYVIHAVGPVWYGGTRGEPQLLANCYRNLFKVAVENGCKSVAVPSISTGVFGYPLEAAIEIAVREAKTFVAAHPDFKVIFVAWAGGEHGGKGTQAKYLRRISDDV